MNSMSSKLNAYDETDSNQNSALIVYQLVYEYLGIVTQSGDLPSAALQRANEIEDQISFIEKILDKQEYNKHRCHFKVFATVKYQYRIWPEEQRNYH